MNRFDFTFSYELRKYTLSTFFENEYIFEKIRAMSTFYELKLLKAIQELNLCGIYVDVGANIGNHSVFFLNECASTEVISIEPEPTLQQALLFNLLCNEHNTKPRYVWPCAVGDKECMVSLTTNLANMGSTFVNGEGGVIPCHTLDSLLFEYADIVLLKIDAEGYEEKILLGAEQLLERWTPVVVCEATTIEVFQRIDFFLGRFGYTTDSVSLAATPTYLWRIGNR